MGKFAKPIFWFCLLIDFVGLEIVLHERMNQERSRCYLLGPVANDSFPFKKTQL